MKTYPLLLIIFLLAFPTIAKAQKTFTKDIQSPEDVFFNDMILTKDNAIIIVTNNPDQYPTNGFYVSKLNLRGGLLLSKKYCV